MTAFVPMTRLALSFDEYASLLDKARDRDLRAHLKQLGYAAAYSGDPNARVHVPLWLARAIDPAVSVR